MVNKKGFTLMEILAAVGLLGLVALIATVSIISLSNNRRNSEYDNVIEQVISAAEVYVALNRNDSRTLLRAGNTYEITLEGLINENLLRTDLVDPRTNQPLELLSFVRIQYNASTGEFIYTYIYD